MEKTTEIQQILKNYTSGNIAADECFCLILSLCSVDELENNFLSNIQTIRTRHSELYNQLCNVYMGYFDIKPSQLPSFLPDLDRAVENGYYATDYDSNNVGFELDLEYALKLSEQEYTKLNSISATPRCSGASYAHALNSHSHGQKNEVKRISAQIAHGQAIEKTQAVPDNQEIDVAKENQKLDMNKDTDIPGQKKRKRNRKKNTVQRPLSNPPVIYWFRRDLRIYDNPALVAAAQTGAPVIPVFLWSDREEGPKQALATGGATKYWLYMALPALNLDFKERFNNCFVYRKTDSYLNELVEIIDSSGANSLYMNDVYEPFLKSRDDKICAVLKSKGVKCERYHSYLLHEPGSIRTESLCMRGIGSVTHFMECCRQSSTSPIGLPVDPPSCLPAGCNRPESMPLEALELGKLPRRKDGTVVRKIEKSVETRSTIHSNVK